MTFFYEPAWSSDGQYLAAGLLHSAETSTPEVQIHGNEIYQVDRDGRETRLTYLTNNYSKSEIGRLAWSPDNRYIAFELNVEPISYPEYAEIDSRGPRLAVLDTQTYQVTNYCIPLGVNGSKLIWSPDSRQIIVQNLNVSNRKMYTLWIDNETGVAAQIAEDMVPVGWMVAP
jgi:Tol biopolymer transport system component